MVTVAVTPVARWVETWAELYGSSAAVQAVALYGHLAAVVSAAGLALGADRKIVRARRASRTRRIRALRDWRRTHRFVLASLALGMLAGIGLLLSDVPRFLPSWIFWVKMTLLGVLVANGRVMERHVGRLFATRGHDDAGDAAAPAVADPGPTPDDEWAPLARASIRSAWLWAATLLAGVLLTTA